MFFVVWLSAAAPLKPNTRTERMGGQVLTWIWVKFTTWAPIKAFLLPLPENNVIPMHFLAPQKGSKNPFNAAWPPWFAFLSRASPSSYFYIITGVFLKPSPSSSPSYAHLPLTAVPCCAYTFPHPRWALQKVWSSPAQATVSPPPSLSRMLASCPGEAQPQLFWLVLLFWFSGLFSWKRFHCILHGGLVALNSLHLLLQKLSVSLRLALQLCQPHLLGLLCPPLGSSYLLPAPQRGDRVSCLCEEWG